MRDDYFDRPGLSASALKAMHTGGPRLFFHRCMTGEADPSPAMMLGTQVHLAVLEPDVFDAEFWTFAGDRRSREFKLEQSRRGGTCLKPADYSKIMGIRRAVREHETARMMVDTSEHEVPRYVRMHGHTCKAKADMLAPDWVGDLKTTRRPDPRGFSWEMLDLGYDIQSAWYMDVFQVDTFFFVVASNSEPYHAWVKRVERGDEIYSDGRRKYMDAIAQIESCFRDGDFRNWYEKATQ